MCYRRCSCLVHHIACCKLFWLRFLSAISTFQLRFASPEVNLFAATGLLYTHGLQPSHSLPRFITWHTKSKAIPHHGTNFNGVDPLNEAPGRKCTNGATSLASLHAQPGSKGINQDAMLVWEVDDSMGDMIVCGVFDGHGPHGHLVAHNVRDSLPLKLVTSWRAAEPTMDGKQGQANHDIGCPSEHSDVLSLWNPLFVSCYKWMDKELLVKSGINCFNSGTTAVILVKQGCHVVIGNVGDSRAVLGTKSGDGSLLAVQLTVDFKPILSKEAERIRHCKGRVFASCDEPTVDRVWLPHINCPGLAMTRALGDFCLKDFGVIAVPEVIHRRLTERDQFIVLASDGVWDVLSNEQVVQIVSSVSERQVAARAVVETAAHLWRTKHPVSKIDDCAVVCLYVNNFSNHSSFSSTKENIASFEYRL